ncbi:circularly permuted type 2 ATP-grasp protein [Ornithinimicrobium sp. Y1694]|uniref:circularly permuted type 2 ATP-grasp protein n=1 Tax=Ornithinimicrobium sp. Y1694 TaxID=3418590 RepID=UPI003CF18C9A
MAGAFENYPTTPGIFDETVEDGGALRAAYEQVAGQFGQLGEEDVRNRAEYVSKTYHDQGVTFDFEGEERPFPLDIVPRIIEAATWSHVEEGVTQRVRALEAFLADVYGALQIVTDKVLPRHVVTTSKHYHRVAFGIQPVNGVRVHVSGIDLIRDGNGDFRVLEDNVRIPSGVSYVLTNRHAMTSTLPEVVGTHRIRPVAAYPNRLLRALRAAAPSGVQDPEVVVLTPGPFNSAYFEHSLLARLMGCRLVEGRDLLTQGGRVMMRTTQGLQPVHVIYRRVDDDFLDPVAFRNDSVLGCPGLLNAARAGNVTIANAVGNGVADDKLMYSYVPELIRYYLGEEPILPNVDTWRLEEPEHREEVMDRLDELVLKPVDGSGGKGIVIGPQASRAELDELRATVTRDPRGWIAQPVVQLSTVPTMVDEGMRPRHVDLRPFAINDGDKVWVLPGGLTRVALGEGELIVNSSRGGGSKDTWVLSGDGRRTRIEPRAVRPIQVAPAPQVALRRSEAEPAEQEQQQQQQLDHQPDQAAGATRTATRPTTEEGMPC